MFIHKKFKKSKTKAIIPLEFLAKDLEIHFSINGGDIINLLKWGLDSVINSYKTIWDREFELVKYYLTATLTLSGLSITLYKYGLINTVCNIVILIIAFFILWLSLSFWKDYIYIGKKIADDIIKNFLWNFSKLTDSKTDTISSLTFLLSSGLLKELNYYNKKFEKQFNCVNKYFVILITIFVGDYIFYFILKIFQWLQINLI